MSLGLFREFGIEKVELLKHDCEGRVLDRLRDRSDGTDGSHRLDSRRLAQPQGQPDVSAECTMLVLLLHLVSRINSEVTLENVP